MIPHPRPLNRYSQSFVTRTPLTIALTLTMVAGTVVSSLVLPVAAAATDMQIGQQADDVAKQPVQRPDPESTPESARAAATAQASPMSQSNADGISVRTYMRECMPGTLTGQPMSYYLGEDQCEGEKLDVVFDVTDENGTMQAISEKGGRQIDHLVGQVTIREILPEGYETPAIFCTSLTHPPGQELTGSGDSVTLLPGTNVDYQCSFYNIPSGLSPTGTGDLLVYTYECASTPPANSTYAWYFQNCRTRQNGATFVLDTPDAAIEANAGESINGAVTMRGLNVGEYPLTETVVVPTHEIGAAFCAEIGKTELPGPAQMTPQPINGNTISAPVTADMLLYCHWYHVPKP